MQRKATLVVTTLAMFATASVDAASLAAQSVSTRPNVMVMNFEVSDIKRHSNSVYLSWSIAELVANRLINMQTVDVRDRRMPQNISQTTNPTLSGRRDSVSNTPALPVRGAQFMVSGSLLVLGTTLRIDARLMDMRTGTVIARTVGSTTLKEDATPVLHSLAARIGRAANLNNADISGHNPSKSDRINF